MSNEEWEPFEVGTVVPRRGGFPRWAMWVIIAVGIVAIIAIAVVVTITLVGGNGNSNQAPEISSLLAVPIGVSPGGFSTITCVASDPEDDTLTYDWTATGGTISGIGSVIGWIAPGVSGTYSIYVSVSDGEGGTANESVLIIVAGVTPTPTPRPTPTPTSTHTPTPTSTHTPTPTAVPNGSISINSSPSGASIYLDSVLNSNVTPYIVTHVSAGTHVVKLLYPDGKWREDDITVYSGETSYINWNAPTVLDVVIQPDGTAGKDASTDEFAPDTNYGNETTLVVAGDGGYSDRMYLQFDLSSIPDSAVIVSADLGLFYHDASITAVDGAVGAYRVTAAWNEVGVTGITWNNSPTTQTTAIDAITVPAIATVDFLTWDISSLVQIWVSTPATNRGIMLKDTDESSDEGWKYFRSSDWTTVDQRPKLMISYYDSNP